MASPGTDLQARREAVVREHMESENRHEFDATVARSPGHRVVRLHRPAFAKTRRRQPPWSDGKVTNQRRFHGGGPARR